MTYGIENDRIIASGITFNPADSLENQFKLKRSFDFFLNQESEAERKAREQQEIAAEQNRLIAEYGAATKRRCIVLATELARRPEVFRHTVNIVGPSESRRTGLFGHEYRRDIIRSYQFWNLGLGVWLSTPAGPDLYGYTGGTYHNIKGLVLAPGGTVFRINVESKIPQTPDVISLEQTGRGDELEQVVFENVTNVSYTGRYDQINQQIALYTKAPLNLDPALFA
jgi:hypothetical protein